MKKLSKFATLRIGVIIKNEIIILFEEYPSLKSKVCFYMEHDYSEYNIELLIAKKSGINISSYFPECGTVNMEQFISQAIEDKTYEIIEPERYRNSTTSSRVSMEDHFKVSEELKVLTNKFESDNIPDAGTCTTTIGEMFRAMQRIEYRAYNDGDNWFEIGSPNFVSYVYLVSMVDKFNYSYGARDDESGDYRFQFTDPFLAEFCCDGKISDIIESSLAEDSLLIKYQLIDLLTNGKIQDTKNEYDSRSYELLTS